MDTFIQQMINGLTLGSVYALIALGYTLIYGIIKLLNFAHGDIFMVGSFVSYYLILSFNMNIVNTNSYQNLFPYNPSNQIFVSYS